MRISKLDGLRGVFSLMIVFFHYREEFLPVFLRQIFFIRESYTFVDFFFVLSGYVITYNYNNNITEVSGLKLYLKKRFARLFPLLFLTTTIMLVFDIIGNHVYPHLVNNVDSLYVLLKRYLDTLLFTNSTPILGSTSGINGVSWSISSEMISYVTFGLISLLAIGKRKNIILALVILTCAAFTIYNGTHFNTGDYGFIRGLISFNMGYFVWLFSVKKVKIPNMVEYAIPVLLLVIFFIMNQQLSDSEKEMFGLAIIPLFFSFAIWVLLNTNGFLSKVLSSKPLVFLGDISYSVYLNHFLFVLVVPKIVFGIFKIPQNIFTEIILLILIVGIIIFVSHLTFKFVEVKGGSLLRKILIKNPYKQAPQEGDPLLEEILIKNSKKQPPQK